MRGRGIDAAQELVNRVGHQDGSHFDFAQRAGLNQPPRFHAVRGEMPGATNQQLQFFLCRSFDQVARLGGREGHRLFDEHMQPVFQRGFGLRVMNIRC